MTEVYVPNGLCEELAGGKGGRADLVTLLQILSCYGCEENLGS